jgi:hypothetical protein
MVMRNRHDGANAPGWWDDLPQGVKERCANSPLRLNYDDDFHRFSEAPVSPSIRIARDFSWLLLTFAAIAFANILFLLVALSFLYGRGPFGH